MNASDLPRSLFVDSSALVKLIKPEAESPAIRALVLPADRFVSELSVVELRRMARREREAPEPLLEKIDPLIDACNLIHMDEVVLELAGNIRHRNLGALDAIHIATALRAAPLDAFVTYDTRQAEAASELGLEVLSPR